MTGKSRIAAALIIVAFVFIGGLYLWAGGEQARLVGYGFLKLDRGQMTVNFDRHWVWLDANGREGRSLDLAAVDLHPVADYDFFANGDLLVLHRAAQRSVWQNLRAFLRISEGPQSAAGTAQGRQDGFYRCQLLPLNCERLAKITQLPARSSRLVIDRQSDTVYLVDTADHSLYKYSASGRLLAQQSTGFKFPNQLLLTEGQLWLADTNNHRVVRLATAEDTFGEVLETHNINLGGEYRWPHQLAASAAGLWVLVGNNAMADGKLRLIEPSGDLAAPISSQALAKVGIGDPLALHFWQKRLWINDFDAPKLILFDPNSGTSTRAQSPTLTQLEQAHIERWEYYQLMQRIALILFVVLLIGGFAAAWRLERQQTLDKFKSVKNANSLSVDGEITPTGQSGVMWISSGLKPWHHWMIYVLWACTLMCSVLLIYLYVTNDKLGSGFLAVMGAMIVFLLLISLVVSKIFRSIVSAKLGVVGESLVLDDGFGNSTIAKDGALAYTAHFIFADDVAIALGNQNVKFFARNELEKWVYPRLKRARKLSAWEQTVHLWRLRHPQMIYMAIILAAMLALLIFLELFS
ncbi:hypothetical protein QWI17_18670 [Gilvimarinus sp. SDUM040013]|uniref:Uncharacterized protein n=1 Tax=Gilvimarinus gilvus TaxID=3058038 RepID=A0ABU4S0K7_9GAMM|nr:hypothetical protein [Gilvimarinus sp. SDUM040013]MDO3387875.1 hypothetical protein [Gilvimarinus sp. SDUM040013]MDX6848754.1 hypothetical protein [Gilvimarinus sp. SDUM040013]